MPETEALPETKALPKSNDTKPATGPDAYIAAAAGLLAIPLDPAWIGAIGSNLSVLRAAADLVGGFPLPDEAEPAPVFGA